MVYDRGGRHSGRGLRAREARPGVVGCRLSDLQGGVGRRVKGRALLSTVDVHTGSLQAAPLKGQNKSAPAVAPLPAMPQHQSAFGYDIAAACDRQRVFNYQVSLPHYHSEEFIGRAVMRYGIFLSQAEAPRQVPRAVLRL